MKRCTAQVVMAGAAVILSSGSASAHALAQRYDLPLPLGYFLAGSGAAVAVTFVVSAAFMRKSGRTGAERVFVRLRLPAVLVGLLQALSVAATVLLVAAGLVGNQDTFKNITPVAVWVIWWIGFGFLSAFVCNLWPLINPWSVAFGWAETIGRRRVKSLSLRLRYPEWLGVWPACGLFFLFAWCELIAPARDIPRNIALAIIAYSVMTWAGCFLFGRACWIKNGEAFSVVFGMFGRFAPLILEENGGWRLGLRQFAVGLIAEESLNPSLCAFALLILGTVTVDGLMETPQWVSILNFVLGGESVEEHPVRFMLAQSGLLVVGPVLLAGVYVGTAALMARSAGAATVRIAGLFVLSLVPIAIAYHLAHYLTLFAIAGQFVIPLLSDPFGRGWDLFGTTLYRIDIGLIDAKLLWYVSVCAIVLGHMIAVWVGHATAATALGHGRAAFRSQRPLLILMVCYTMLSLWILAQPIIEPSGK